MGVVKSKINRLLTAIISVLVILMESAPVKATIRRKITLGDIEAICELVAKRITETGACQLLGIEPTVWFSWKSRRSGQLQFDNILSRVRETQIKSHLEVIEGAQITDWRAADRLLAIKAPERFGKQDGVQVNVLTINGAPNEIVEAARQAFLSQAKGSNCGVQGQIQDVKTTITSVQESR